MIDAREQLLDELVHDWRDREILWDAWLDGLQSGTYHQGRIFLLRRGSYCPLGVLCAVALIAPTWPNGPDVASFAGYATSLPPALAEFMNMTVNGMFKNCVPALKSIMPRREYPASSIISLNDTAGWTFDQIARYLRENRNNVRPFEHKP